MLTLNSIRVHSEEYAGLTVSFYAHPESIRPQDWYGAEDADLVDEILSGRCEWFTAQVVAELDGVELDSAYLGACAYPTFEDFLSSGYWEDLRDEATEGARRRLATLGDAARRVNAFLGSDGRAALSPSWQLQTLEGRAVQAGEQLKSFRGEVMTITGGRPPLHQGSTGRVWTEDGREYFPGVFDLKWVRTGAPA